MIIHIAIDVWHQKISVNLVGSSHLLEEVGRIIRRLEIYFGLILRRFLVQAALRQSSLVVPTAYSLNTLITALDLSTSFDVSSESTILYYSIQGMNCKGSRECFVLSLVNLDSLANTPFNVDD